MKSSAFYGIFGVKYAYLATSAQPGGG